MDLRNSGSRLLKMALSSWEILSSGIRSPNPFLVAQRAAPMARYEIRPAPFWCHIFPNRVFLAQDCVGLSKQCPQVSILPIPR